MLSPTEKRAGFTLIELLIVVAIIGIIAAMLIPNLLDAMNKAKQKRTMADMRLTGTAMMSWLTDQASAAASGSAATTLDLSDYAPINFSDLEGILSPLYINTVGPRDGWKKSYGYYLNTDDPLSKHVMAMRSGGRDKIFAATLYTAGGFVVTDYDQDIIWADGFFVRWPQGSR